MKYDREHLTVWGNSSNQIVKKCYKEVRFCKSLCLASFSRESVMKSAAPSYVCLTFVEPQYSRAVQPAQSSAAVGPLLHWLVALRPTEGAVPGDPHALHYLQVDLRPHF